MIFLGSRVSIFIIYFIIYHYFHYLFILLFYHFYYFPSHFCFRSSYLLFFMMFEYFRLTSKTKIEIIEAKHQTCFLIV